ncbi:unnamed protein product [Effrenium voratum]|nr:unnamed protein product [Effrenium voratum]
MALKMGKSISLPGLWKMGTEQPKLHGHHKKATLGFTVGGDLASAVDKKKGPVPSAEGREIAGLLKTAGWRMVHTEQPKEPPLSEEEIVHANMRQPREAPAWMKHDKQVLRFYGFFQETVTEHPIENSRYRHVNIMYHMEDGSLSMTEPKTKNSGLPQGTFLKRQKTMREDGLAYIGPDDLRVGSEITIHGRTIHINGCDRFTRWFLEQNGLEVPEDETIPEDKWTRTAKLRATTEQGGMPMTRSSFYAKQLAKFMSGQPPSNMKFSQFLLNDRKVLKFKAYWDDHTPYGARLYFIVHYFLADNTVEINMANSRNSGRDPYPVFMKRGPLTRKNEVLAVPGLLAAEGQIYYPEDLRVGDVMHVWGRKLVLYDCDDATEKFYREYLEIDQKEGKLDVSEKPLTHLKLLPPPHTGVGREEDSLINCQMVQPKPPKKDLEKLMVYTGEVLRFECRMMNGEPEDELRRLVIAYYPADDEVAVFEVTVRNSGHMGGKFADKRRIKNPDTGAYFKLTDLFVGQVVTIAAQPLLITRADEHCLQYLEARASEFPYADCRACALRVAVLANQPEMRAEEGLEPERLKELAQQAGVHLVDHEVVTLLRSFGVAAETEDGSPRIIGPEVLKCAGL